MVTGMMVITNNVLRGERPAEVKPAYDKAPNSPAPPVPEEYVDITFLKKTKQKRVVVSVTRATCLTNYLISSKHEAPNFYNKNYLKLFSYFISDFFYFQLLIH